MKKIIAMILTLTMMLCMAVFAFALSGPTEKITGMVQGLSHGYSASGGDAVLNEVNPQDERVEYIYLYDSMFSWDNGYLPEATPTQLTSSQIRAARMDVRSNRSTRKVVESISINQRESRIEVKFAKEYIGVREIDFDFDVVLSIDGHRQSDYAMNFSGTFLNPIIEVYSDYENIDISDGSVAHARNTSPSWMWRSVTA